MVVISLADHLQASYLHPLLSLHPPPIIPLQMAPSLLNPSESVGFEIPISRLTRLK